MRYPQIRPPHLSLSAISRAGIVLPDKLDRLLLCLKVSFQLGIFQGGQHFLEIGPWAITHILQIDAGQ